MKKVLKLVLVMVISIVLMGVMNSVQALTGNVTMQASKAELQKGEEFTVDVSISNINSKLGVVAFGATLEYEKNALTYVKMETQNGYGTPLYNPENGIIVIENYPVKTDGVVVKITFKVNENTTKSSTMITLKDIMAADGTNTAIEVTSLQKSIAIKQNGNTQNPDENQGEDNQGGNNNNQGGDINQGNDNQGDNNNQNGNDNQENNNNQGGDTNQGNDNQGDNNNQNGNDNQGNNNNQGGNSSQEENNNQGNNNSNGDNSNQSGNINQGSINNQGANNNQSGNGNQGNSNNQGTNSQNGNSNGVSNNSNKAPITSSNGNISNALRLPQTGENNIAFILAGVIFIIVAIYFLIKIILKNKHRM